MAWLPTYVNEGLFNNTPEGNLTVPFDNAREIGNLWTDGSALLCNYSSSESDTNYKTWNAARGKSFSNKLIGILNNNHGSSGRNVILAAYQCKNPEGAQFYKQELVVYGSWFSSEIRHTQDPYNFLDYYYAEIEVQSIARREWATPTATPTVTNLHVSTVGLNFFVVIQGDISLERFYDFLSKGYFCAGNVHYNNKYYFGVGLYIDTNNIITEDGQNKKNTKSAFAGVALDIDYLDEVFGGTFEPEATEDPNEEPDEPGGGESGEGGGEGDHDNEEDNIPDPGLPPIGAASAGFVHMFKLTLTDMVAFARTMFDDSLWMALKNWFSDPMDFISGIMLLPFTPEGDTVRYPKFGSNIWPQSFTLVSNQFYRLDCGHLTCKRYYDSFLDYDSYSKVKIFLPYIGYKDLVADEVMGNNLHVYYNIDVATGDCVAFIEINDGEHEQITYQFQGNCGTQVPYGRQSFDAAVNASLSMLTGTASTALAIGGAAAVTGGMGAVAAGIAAAQISGQIGSMTASAISGSKRTMERSGAVGGSAGYMGVQYPYLIRQIPNQSRPGNYRQLHGYPSNIGGKLNTFQGYTTIEHILLENLVCTDTEKTEIIEMMKGGVII